MITKVFIGNDQIELYKDESVEIVSAVADINDISKNLTDYSKTFAVPASEVNNRIFKHYYDADIDNSFDARTKVSGRIELDGMPFKEGKFRLEKVVVKNNEPSSYTINFWGNLVSLKNKFKNDDLSSLNLSAYDHTYTSANIKTGLTTSLFSGNIIYNLFAKKQYYYNSNASDTTNTDTLSNIHYKSGAGGNGVKASDLRPSLLIIRIIEAIESKYNVTFSRDFFGRDEFQKLYLWLNNDAEKEVSFEQRCNFSTGTNPYFNFTTDEATYNESSGFNKVLNAVSITPLAGFTTIPYTLNIYVDGVIQATHDYIGNSGELKKTILLTNANQVVYFTVKTNTIFSFDCEYKATFFVGILPSITRTINGTSNTVNSIFNISNNIPKLKITEFLDGLFKLFKLVIIADAYDNVYINTFVDYYRQGKLIDVTPYVKTDSVDIERGKILNEINFKFSEAQTLLAKQFIINTGQSYGNESLFLEDADGVPLDGDSLNIEVPFEQVIYERLIDVDDNGLTNIQYGGMFDESISPIAPKAHLFYNLPQAIGSKHIAFINDIGVKEELAGSTKINNPIHTLGITEPLYSTLFSEEFNEWNGNLINNTLYSNYYQSYIDAIFNIKKRNYGFGAILPLHILLKIELNDVLKIRNNYYRIDNYSVNIINGEARLNLVNSFDNTIAPFKADKDLFVVDNDLQGQSVYISNLLNYSVVISDTWVTITSVVGQNVYFQIDANVTASDRQLTMTFTNTDTGQVEVITIIQEA